MWPCSPTALPALPSPPYCRCMVAANELRFSLRPMAFMDSVRESPCRYAAMRAEPPQALLVWQPEALGRIFQTDRTMRMDGSSTLGPLVGEHSLLYANGSRHAGYRKVLGAKLRGGPLAACRAPIESITQRLVDELRPGAVIDVPEWTRQVAFRIICQIVLGEEDIPRLRPFTEWVESALGTPRRTLVYRYFRPNPRWPSPWRTFLRGRAELCEAILEHLRQGGDRGLAELLTTGSAPLGEVSAPDLCDQVVSLLFAGHETTASALAWALYWIDRDERLRQDLVAEVTGTSGDGSVAEDFPLLEATCRETLRLTPPAILAGNRVVQSPTELLGRELAEGSRVTPCIYLAHRNPDLYPDPDRFDATRFLGARPNGQTYLPFGGGTRRCLGADLAQLELRMVLTVLLRRRTLRLAQAADSVVAQARGPALGPGPQMFMTVQRQLRAVAAP